MTITLASRKNSAGEVTLKRNCVCSSTGAAVCPIHLMKQLQATSGTNAVFATSVHRFTMVIRRLAEAVGHAQARYVGTHSFRRGMAQDILDSGGTLATLLRAGGWTSSAFQLYVRSEQIQDTAVGQLLIELSDSDED